MSKHEIHHVGVVWADGRVDTLAIDEVVYPDRTCGQYEGGWLVYRPGQEDNPDGEMYFISDSGSVWIYASELEVGIAPEIVASFQRELERDRAYWEAS